MSAREQLLSRLARLQPRDRAWLVGQLSTDERRSLMDLASADPAAGAAPEANTIAMRTPADDELTSLQALRNARAAQIATLLEGEPAWLTRALVDCDDWPWKHEFLEQLVPATRARVLHAPAPALSQLVRDALLQHCALRLPEQRSAMGVHDRATLRKRFANFLVGRRLALRR